MLKKYTFAKEIHLTEQYGMTAGQMRETVAETRLYPDMYASRLHG
jgi:hypothetical protein